MTRVALAYFLIIWLIQFAFIHSRGTKAVLIGLVHFEQGALQLPQPVILFRQKRAVPVRPEEVVSSKHAGRASKRSKRSKRRQRRQYVVS